MYEIPDPATSFACIAIAWLGLDSLRPINTDRRTSAPRINRDIGSTNGNAGPAHRNFHSADGNAGPAHCNTGPTNGDRGPADCDSASTDINAYPSRRRTTNCAIAPTDRGLEIPGGHLDESGQRFWLLVHHADLDTEMVV